MGDPTTIGQIGIGTNIAGGIFGAVGAEQQGQATQQMYNYQAQVQQINAQIDRQNAAFAINQGELQAQTSGLQAGQRMGQIKAAQASAGLDVNSGSDLKVQQSQQLVTNMDLTQIRSNANKSAYDFETQAVGAENQGQLDTLAGQNAAEAGNINAFSTVLGTASSVSTKWLQGQQIGLWGAPS